jgi:hypothetical protein
MRRSRFACPHPPDTPPCQPHPQGTTVLLPLFSPLEHAGSRLPLRALPLVAALTRHAPTPFTSGKELAAPIIVSFTKGDGSHDE